MHGGTAPTQVFADDVLVVPENRMSRLRELFPGVPKIVLNQNPYLAAKQLCSQVMLRDLLGTINTSDACQSASTHLLPNVAAHRVPLWLERNLFAPVKAKSCQIAYMPRRMANDAQMVLNLLAASGAAEGIEIVPIDNRPIDEVARVLRESLIFLSFAQHEGFGLPGAEAIASGCLTVGCTGGGGDEYFSRFGGWPVAQQDAFGFADTVMDVLKRYAENPDAMDAARLDNAQAILAHYKQETTVAALADALAALVGPPK